MCDVLDKVENRGIAKGKIEGEMEGKAQVTTWNQLKKHLSKLQLRRLENKT